MKKWIENASNLNLYLNLNLKLHRIFVPCQKKIDNIIFLIEKYEDTHNTKLTKLQNEDVTLMNGLRIAWLQLTIIITTSI